MVPANDRAQAASAPTMLGGDIGEAILSVCRFCFFECEPLL